nr:hypothetical protein [Tanacetum cinerariifolium]
GRIAEIDVAEDLSLVNETTQDQGRMNDQDLFGVHDLDGDEVFVDVTFTENVEQDATAAEKEVITLAQTLIEIKATKPKPLKKKNQIALDEEVARKLEAEMKAEMDEEEWILAKQIQAQEREQLPIKERSKLLVELDESSRKYFATKRAEEIRNKPPIKVQAKVADDDNVELKRCLEIVPEDNDDVAIETTPISSKSPTIVDYKIYKEGKKS